ncbi:hypothetical protein S245_013238, partial [Arachis hypogaea]
RRQSTTFLKRNISCWTPQIPGDKVRDKIRSLTPDGIIPYDEFVKMIKSKGNLLVRKPKIVLIWELSVNNLVFLLVIQGNLKVHPIEKFLNLILKRISEDLEKIFKNLKLKNVSKRISKITHTKTPLFAIH